MARYQVRNIDISIEQARNIVSRSYNTYSEIDSIAGYLSGAARYLDEISSIINRVKSQNKKIYDIDSILKTAGLPRTDLEKFINNINKSTPRLKSLAKGMEKRFMRYSETEGRLLTEKDNKVTGTTEEQRRTASESLNKQREAWGAYNGAGDDTKKQRRIIRKLTEKGNSFANEISNYRNSLKSKR